MWLSVSFYTFCRFLLKASTDFRGVSSTLNDESGNNSSKGVFSLYGRRLGVFIGGSSGAELAS